MKKFMNFLYSLLFIDADDTLYDFQQCEINALGKTFKENGIPFSKNNIERYHLFNGKLWKDLEKGFITQDEIKHERFRLLVEDLKLDIDYMKLSMNYIHNISNERVLMPGAEEVCKYLASKYSIINLTNGITENQL
jgi:2-haloacid dehalogenase